MSFPIATAEALAFCDESFRRMMGNVMWGLNNLKQEFYPRSQDFYKASSFARVLWYSILKGGAPLRS